MQIQPASPSIKGPGDWFTGEVWIDYLAQGPAQARVTAVHFAPGARTAWHAHVLGQTLCVTEGEGRVQSRGEPVVVIRPGDIVSTPAAEWHWHGAAPDHFMTHLSVTEAPAEGQGPDPDWGQHVTDAEYLG
jgi:quercetin dioxygenase-like cupin family protein